MVGTAVTDIFTDRKPHTTGELFSLWAQNTIAGAELGLAVDLTVATGGVAALPGAGAPVRAAVGGLVGAGLSGLTFGGEGQTWSDFAANQAIGAGAGAAIGVVPELAIAASAYGVYQGAVTIQEGNAASTTIGLAEVGLSLAPLASQQGRQLMLGRMSRTLKGAMQAEAPVSLFGGEPVPRVQAPLSQPQPTGNPAVPTLNSAVLPAKPAPRVTGEALATLRSEFESVAKPAYWQEYVRQIDEGVMSNPFGRAEVNLSRMRQGLPPLGPDGKPVPLHHIRPLSRGGSNDFGNLVPFNQTTHQRHTKILHNEPFPGEQYHLQQR